MDVYWEMKTMIKRKGKGRRTSRKQVLSRGIQEDKHDNQQNQIKLSGRKSTVLSSASIW